MTDDSVPQYTPEEIAEKHKTANLIVETFLKERNTAITTRPIGDETWYSLFEWFNILYDDAFTSLDLWNRLVFCFIVTGAPMSVSTVLLPYVNLEKGIVGECLMEFGSSLALVMLAQISEREDFFEVPEIRYSLSQFDIPSRRIPVPETTEQGYLYMIHIDGMDEYKIGYTENFQRRLKQYKSHTPPSTLWVVDYCHKASLPRNVEASIHRVLDRFRVGGEWFKMDKSWVLIAKAVLAKLQSAANCFEDHEDMVKRIAQYMRDAGHNVDDNLDLIGGEQ